MGLFRELFGHDLEQDEPELRLAIERALTAVEPLLIQTSGYYGIYRKSIATALEYAHSLADSVPGPVAISRESYARDALVHALFPSVDFVTDAFISSQALQDYYREFPGTDELYALMGMRRMEKTVIGMELAGEVMQRDVVQEVVYFTGHVIENPAPTEQLARDRVALSFFDSLVSQVKQRVDTHKLEKQSQLQEKDLLIARLRVADAQERPELEQQLSGLLASMQSFAGSHAIPNYVDDFEAVLLNPEQHLSLKQTPIFLDSMGIRREPVDGGHEEPVLFNELIGFDRRNWTVVMVHCGNLQSESFATRLEKAHRKLAI